MSIEKRKFVNGLGGKHNSLFTAGPNIRLNACVGQNGGPAGYDRYSRGYFRAGALLVKSLQEDTAYVDSVIYPLVLVFRHGAETGLKHLAIVLPPLCEDASEPKLNHKLIDNWKIVRPLLEKLEFEQNEIDQVGNTLKDLVEIDGNGEPFRYPATKDNKPYLQETRIINVDVFAEGMSFIASYFDYLFDMVKDLQEAKYEEHQEEARARHEMADYYGHDEE